LVGDINKSVNQNTQLTFATSEFTGKFTDPDGNSLVKIVITSLPANGTLKLNGTPVTVNQEIASADLGKLTFDPTPSWSGNTSFGWNGSDGSLYAVNAGRVNIAVILTNNAPVVSGFTETINQNQTLPFVSTDFTSNYTDADKDNLVDIRIETLPANGDLLLNGVAIRVDQLITLSDIGKLQFVPDKDYTGENSFTWSGFDGKEYSKTPATVMIKIVPFEVFIPEGFSPNGDGVNDYFVIKGAERYTVTLNIFNRWGNLVYESAHYMNDWTGKANVGMLISNELPGGTYFYTANFNNGTKAIIGYLTINR
jgi:gliding motility-associated-like protein